LKNNVLLLILCGLIFSSGSFINRFSHSGPEYGEVLSLQWLEHKFSNNEKVFSYYEYGYLITAYSGAEVYTDKRYYQSSRDKMRIIQSNDVFSSRNLKNITNFLKKNDLTYIWINQEMKDGLIWSNEDEGMLFVLASSNSFKRIYKYLGVEIWKYQT